MTDIRAKSQIIPHIPSKIIKLRNGDFRRKWHEQEAVAMTLQAIINERHRSIRPIRLQNGLASTALLIIDGCCKDHILEDLWSRRRSAIYPLFYAENPCIIVAPDMSVYSDMSPCHKLYEIKRSFIMYEHFQSEGFITIPFPSPDSDAHVECFSSWLRENNCVTHVAANAQTFRRNVYAQQRHINYLAKIQNKVQRPLEWLIIGKDEDSILFLENQLKHVHVITAHAKFSFLQKQRAESQKLF